jgi:hypothetical protein
VVFSESAMLMNVSQILFRRSWAMVASYRPSAFSFYGR